MNSVAGESFFFLKFSCCIVSGWRPWFICNLFDHVFDGGPQCFYAKLFKFTGSSF
jgi:hypothetical protein